MTTGVILPPDWLIMEEVAIPAEIAIIATSMKRGPEHNYTGQTTQFENFFESVDHSITI